MQKNKYPQITKPAKFIRLDLFPAKIVNKQSMDILGEEFRVIITNDHMYFFIDGGDHPIIHSDYILSEFEKIPKVGYSVETDSQSFEITRASNCGCGSGLRGFYPFLGVPYKKN